MSTLLLAVAVGACQAPPKELKIESLLRHELARELAPDREVIVSYLEIPPHTTLPWHWHPGEEFAYMLDGALTAHVGGKDVPYAKGAAGAVPFKAVHTASTGAEGARLLVFRVHMKGQPERHLVDAPPGHDHQE